MAKTDLNPKLTLLFKRMRRMALNVCGYFCVLGCVIVGSLNALAQGTSALTQVITRQPTELKDAPNAVGRMVLRVPTGTRLEQLAGRFGPWIEVRAFKGQIGWLQSMDVTGARLPMAILQQPAELMTPSAPATAQAPVQAQALPSPQSPPARQPTQSVASLAPVAVGLAAPVLATHSAPASPPVPPLLAQIQAPITATPSATPSAKQQPAQAEFTVAEQRLEQLRTYRADSDAARKLAFYAPLELTRIPRALYGPPDGASPEPQDGMAMAVLPNGESAVPALDSMQERITGREMALAVLAQNELNSDVRLQTYVNQLGKWLALESTRGDLDWTFGVLASSQIKAFATVDGTVFVTTGLVNTVRSEAELAALLAQQMGRVTLELPLKNLLRRPTGAKSPDTPLASMGAERLRSITQTLYAQGPLHAKEEARADGLAVSLLARTGFNPKVMLDAMARTSPNGDGKTFFSALVGPDSVTLYRTAELNKYMGFRFDEYADRTSPSVAERLKQLYSPEN